MAAEVARQVKTEKILWLKIDNITTKSSNLFSINRDKCRKYVTSSHFFVWHVTCHSTLG